MVWKVKHLDSIQLNINCLQFDRLVNKVSHIIFNREEDKLKYDNKSNVIPLTKDGICVSKWRTTSFLYKSNWGMDDPEDTLKITNAELRKILGLDPDSESA